MEINKAIARNTENEKYIEQMLCRIIREMGGTAYKFVSPNRRGVPDRICLLPGGEMFFVEVKSRGKKPSPLQEIEIEKLRKLGFSVYVLDSVGEISNLIAGHYAK